MTLNKTKKNGNMFASVGYTWNPIWGCTFGCYGKCWAHSLAEKQGKSFEPQFREHYLKDKLPDDGSWIFVCSMGDINAYGMETKWVLAILEKISKYNGSNKFLLQSKDPAGFFTYLPELTEIKDKIIFGTTLETNRVETTGLAPSTRHRFEFMTKLKDLGFKTFLSLEPLADFDVSQLVGWIVTVKPEAVEIGLENYTKTTIKPSDEKVVKLIEQLDRHGITYHLKANLKRLQKGVKK